MENNRLSAACIGLVRETWLTSWELIRIMVPVMIIVKLLEEFEVIPLLSAALAPVMGLVGLPGDVGLVWATAMLTTLYGGMAVFAVLAPPLDLTVAQVTVLCSMMLIAHALPIELSISRRAGAPLLPILLLRFGGAVVYGMLLAWSCAVFDLWQQPAALLFSPSTADLNLVEWGVQQLRNLGLIVLVICAILLLMKLLRRIGALGLLERLLAPVLPLFGMGRQAAPLAVVGMIMGLGYGGALIIRETAKGEIAPAEVTNAMAMMGLCHGLVEDTLLMLALGGALAGILWGRIVFSLIVIFLLVRILSILPVRVKWAG